MSGEGRKFVTCPAPNVRNNVFEINIDVYRGILIIGFLNLKPVGL